MKTDYHAHDKAYQQLKSSGHGGWGGETHSERVSSWINSVNFLENKGISFKNSKVLELGSGAGDLSLELAKRGALVSGIDISRTAVQWTKEKFILNGLSGNFYLGNVTNLNRFQDEEFDIVMDGNCLHCIIGEDRSLVFKEIKRVLKKDGLFYLSCMVGDPKSELSAGSFDETSRCQVRDGIAYRYMPKESDLLLEIKNAGFFLKEKWISEHSWWDHFHGILTR